MLRKLKGFTLLELIVVIVILGILAALAIPTFAGVIRRSHDETTLASLKSVAREAQAVNALDANSTWFVETDKTIAAAEAAIGDLSAYREGTIAAGKTKAVVDVIPSQGEIGYMKDDEGKLRLIKLSPSGNYCVTISEVTSSTIGSCGPAKEDVKPGDVFDDEVIELPGLPTTPGGEPSTPAPSPSPTTPAPSPSPTTPPAPTYSDNGVVTGVSVSDITTSGATIAWSPVDKATGYTVTYRLSTGTPRTVTTNSGTTSTILSGLTPESNYVVYVQATRPDTPAKSADTTFTTLAIKKDFYEDMADLPVAMSNVSAVVLNNTIYAVGNGGQNFYAYDKTSNTWVAKTAPDGGASVNSQNNLVVLNGQIYSVNTSNQAVALYNTTTNTWTPRKALIAKRAGAAVYPWNGSIMVTGGGTTAGPIESYESYNPGNNAWTEGPRSVAQGGVATVLGNHYYRFLNSSMSSNGSVSLGLTTSNPVKPTDTSRTTATSTRPSVTNDGSNVLIFKSTPVTFENYLEIYNPQNGQYSVFKQFPKKVHSAGMVMFDNEVVIIGGVNPGTLTSTNDVFTIPLS